MLRHDAGFNHAQVEVEMPEYNRLPGGDPAGPPDYFKGESSKWEAISDLDNFFERVYRFFTQLRETLEIRDFCHNRCSHC
ncbi:unnamed protein product [Calypogeia fissa]